jgi:hypothetical protein
MYNTFFYRFSNGLVIFCKLFSEIGVYIFVVLLFLCPEAGTDLQSINSIFFQKQFIIKSQIVRITNLGPNDYGLKTDVSKILRYCPTSSISIYFFIILQFITTFIPSKKALHFLRTRSRPTPHLLRTYSGFFFSVIIEWGDYAYQHKGHNSYQYWSYHPHNIRINKHRQIPAATSFWIPSGFLRTGFVPLLPRLTNIVKKEECDHTCYWNFTLLGFGHR